MDTALSGHPLLSGQLPKSQNLFPLFTWNETFIKWRREKYLKWSFLLLPTCIKWTLVIKFHHPTFQTAETWKIAVNYCKPQIFQFLHLKTWLDEFIWFRFVCIKLFSLIWFLQIWVAIYVYGTMINWFTLIKKLMQTYIVTVSGSILNISTVHLNGIWHLIWR